MEINYFKEFLALAEGKSYLDAAEELYISQSVLSKHIQKMESELGVPLFIRSTHSVTLSEYGKLFLPYVKKMLQIKEEYEQVLNDNKDSSLNTLTIGSISALAQYNITDIIAGFKKSHKNTTINITLGRSSGLLKMIRNGKCDFAFIREAEEMDSSLDCELVRIPYAEDALAAVLPANHKYAKNKTVDLKLLSNEHFMFLGNDNMPYHLCRNACLRSGFEPDIAFTNRQPETLIELVSSGMGIALLMKPLAEYFSSPSVSIVEVTPTVKSYLNLFYLKDKNMTTIAKEFKKYVLYELKKSDS